MPLPLFSIQPGDGLPIYRQIVEQVKAAIAGGSLQSGDKLPTHRDLARELVVAPLTVKKAYDFLQAEGLIAQAQGRGTFVTGALNTPLEARRGAREELSARARALVRQARILGLSPEDLERMIRRLWKPGKVKHV